MSLEARATPKPARTQRRGLERRRLILDTTLALLATHSPDELTLADIAKSSAVPLSSLYHFYPSLLEVYSELTQRFGTDLSTFLTSHSQPQAYADWSMTLSAAIEACAAFYQSHPGYAQLILSGKAPYQIKQSDREQDGHLARQYLELLNTLYLLPAIPNLDRILFHATEIIDLMLSLDYIKYGTLSPEGILEAKRASKAYLRTYLPELLLPRPAE